MEKQNKEKKLWFKNKTYGYGWYPASIEGWMCIIVYVLFIALLSTSLGGDNVTVRGTVLPYFLYVVFATFLLIYTAYKHGEKPKWQWGKKEPKENKN